LLSARKKKICYRTSLTGLNKACACVENETKKKLYEKKLKKMDVVEIDSMGEKRNISEIDRGRVSQ
jgi:hypothetical protein